MEFLAYAPLSSVESEVFSLANKDNLQIKQLARLQTPEKRVFAVYDYGALVLRWITDFQTELRLAIVRPSNVHHYAFNQFSIIRSQIDKYFKTLPISQTTHPIPQTILSRLPYPSEEELNAKYEVIKQNLLKSEIQGQTYKDLLAMPRNKLIEEIDGRKFDEVYLPNSDNPIWLINPDLRSHYWRLTASIEECTSDFLRTNIFSERKIEFADEVYALANRLIDSWNLRHVSLVSSSDRPFEILRIGKSLFEIRCLNGLIGQVTVNNRELILSKNSSAWIVRFSFFKPQIEPQNLLDEMWVFLVTELQMSESPRESDAPNRSAFVTRATQLILVLKKFFIRDELKSLCMELGEDFENITTESNKEEQARQIATYFQGKGRICELVNQVCTLRPHTASELKGAYEC